MLGPILECGEIQGQPLRLIPSETAHLPTFVRWLNDPAITRYLASAFSFSQAMEEKWFEGTCTDPNRVHWAIQLGDTIIGATGVEDINWLHRTAVTGILIGEREHWGKGVASAVMARRSEYAFNRLNLVALYTEIYVENEYSLRAARKNGYVEYGRKPFARYQDGRYLDAWLGVLSREDWLLRPNA
jgi:RimJ/RimL family protein N-acetyltransferase